MKATATRAAEKTVPPMAALLMKPLLAPSAGVESEAGPGVSAAGDPAGVSPPAAGPAAGDGLGVASDDGLGVGLAIGPAGAGAGLAVGEAVGETVGAPAGDWAMHELASRATRINTFIAEEEAIFVFVACFFRERK